MTSKTSRDQALETTGVLALAAIVIGTLFALTWLYYTAGILLFIGLFLDRLASTITRGWLAFAHALGTVNTRILLSIVFYLVLTPIAVVYRIAHGDFLHIAHSKKGASLWHIRDHEYASKDLENMW